MVGTIAYHLFTVYSLDRELVRSNAGGDPIAHYSAHSAAANIDEWLQLCRDKNSLEHLVGKVDPTVDLSLRSLEVVGNGRANPLSIERVVDLQTCKFKLPGLDKIQFVEKEDSMLVSESNLFLESNGVRNCMKYVL